MKAWHWYYPLVILQGNGRREGGEWKERGRGVARKRKWSEKGREKEVFKRQLVAREAVNRHSYNNSCN